MRRFRGFLKNSINKLLMCLCVCVVLAAAPTFAFELPTEQSLTHALNAGAYPVALAEAVRAARAAASPELRWRAELAAVQALRGLGRYRDAVARAAALQAAIGHRAPAHPLRAAALVQWAAVLRLDGQYAAAERVVREALAWYAAHGGEDAAPADLWLTQAWLARTFGQLHRAWRLAQRAHVAAAPDDAALLRHCALLDVAIAVAAQQPATRQPWFVQPIVVPESPSVLLDTLVHHAAELPEHPVTLAIWIEAATVALAAGELERAAADLQAAHAMLAAVPWLAEHPLALRVRLLALHAAIAQDPAGALRDAAAVTAAYREVLARGEQLLGREHPALLAIAQPLHAWLQRCANELPDERDRLRAAHDAAHMAQRIMHRQQLIQRYQAWSL